MTDEEYVYDKKQNRKYNYLVLINYFVGFYLFFQIFSFLIKIIKYFTNNEKIIIHNLPFYIFIFFLCIIFLINIYLIRKIKFSNVKYYTFKLEKNLSLKDLEEKISLINDREISDGTTFIKRIKIDKRSYRLLLYLDNDFNKKTFDKVKNDLHKKYNKKYNISFRRGSFHTESAIRINLIISNIMNDNLNNYMSQHATGLNTGIITVSIAIIEDKAYAQPIKKPIEFPLNIYYFGTIEKTISFLNNL